MPKITLLKQEKMNLKFRVVIYAKLHTTLIKIEVIYKTSYKNLESARNNKEESIKE